MRLLAFETATRWISVALWQDGYCIERRAELPSSGSEVVLPWAHELLAEAGITFGQLDGIAFGAGPGGFTGLRLSCGVTQGLAWGLDIPVVPVCTLAALALNAATISGDGRIWIVLDARMNEVYSALYRVAAGAAHELSGPICIAPEKIAVPPAPTFDARPLTGAGDGFLVYAQELSAQITGARVECTVLPDIWPTAAAVARLGAPVLAGGARLAAADAQPLYVRDKVALTTAERLARGGHR